MTQFKSEEYSWPADVPLRMNKKEEMSPEELYAPVEYYKTEDPIVNTVIRKLIKRSNTGMQTYKMTMWDNPMVFKEWLLAFQEELLDAANYIERILKDLNGK